MGHRVMTLIVLLGRRIRILQGLWIQVEGLCAVVVLVITDCRRHTVELQTDAGGARPCVRRCGIAFDFTPAASFACSHYCSTLALAYSGSADSHQGMVPHLLDVCVYCARLRIHSLMAKSVTFPQNARRRVMDSLRWFSRGASVGGAKVKLCICAVWGSRGRPVVSWVITSMCTTSRSGVPARSQAWWLSSGVIGYPPSR
jgi:hypothetical protein